MSLRTFWLVPGVGVLAILGGLMGLIRAKGLAERDWEFLLAGSLASFYPFYYLFNELSSSATGTSMLETGFWVAAAGNAIVLVSSVLGTVITIFKK